MKSLITILDGAAPSFCYYEKIEQNKEGMMSPSCFEEVVRFARARELSLQIICGKSGLPQYAKELLGKETPYLCYVPAGATNIEPDDIPVVTANNQVAIEAIEPGKHSIAILRVNIEELSNLTQLVVDLSTRVYRIVVVLLGLGEYTLGQLDTYEAILKTLREMLRSAYVDGQQLEWSNLSDRIALKSANHCLAGIDHVTVDPNGELHVCPGFACDGDTPIGTLASEIAIPNKSLLKLENAPICAICDAYHCRRCVYLNKRTTLEINTPPWQLCRVSHLERESSRVLLNTLHGKGMLKKMKGIPAIRYQDPLEAFLNPELKINGKKGKPRGKNALPDKPHYAPTSASADAKDNKVKSRADNQKRTNKNEEEPLMQEEAVGRVTPEERDKIKELYLRKSGLSELFGTLTKLDKKQLDESPLYEKLIKDMGEVSIAFQGWWDEMASKYKWKGVKGKKWRIDFESCDIFIE